VKIHEYQAKEILKKLGVPVPKGRPAFSIDEAEAAAKALIAETDNEFVERISQLLGDAARRRELAEYARRFALEHLGWEHALESYERLHDRLLSASAAERDHERVAAEAAEAEAAAPATSVPPAAQDPKKPG
jgi:pyruvate/2-oxoglutarate dehydrogenase complex dihydrolipoamide acyltransferase (E2) component